MEVEKRLNTMVGRAPTTLVGKAPTTLVGKAPTTLGFRFLMEVMDKVMAGWN